jgi:hypothetical protein
MAQNTGNFWSAERLINSLHELEEMPHAERNGSSDDDTVTRKVAVI